MVLLSEITVCRLQASVRSTGVSGRNTHGVALSSVLLHICGLFNVGLHESLDV